MRTFVLILMLITCVGQTVDAQRKHDVATAAVHKHNVIITAGYGAPSIIRAYVKYRTSRKDYTVTGYGPLMLKAEYMIGNRVGISLNGAYSRSKLSWMEDGWDTVQLKYRKFESGVKAYEISGVVRGNYHFMKREKWDAYAGVGLGYGKIHMQMYTKAHTSCVEARYNVPRPISLEATSGFRYFPTKHIGLYAEAGLGKCWLLFERFFLAEAFIQGGLVFKF